MITWISQYILFFIVLTPLLGVLVSACLPAGKPKLHRAVALAATLLTFIFSLHLVCHFVAGSAEFQFQNAIPGIPFPNSQALLGVDGFSLWLVILTTFLVPIAVLFSIGSIREREKTFYLCLLFLEVGMLGSLVALDAFLFYIFWEAMLIPMFFLIGIFGHGRKIYSAIKFFIFTLIGSVLMLVGMIYLYLQSGSFLITDWYQLSLPLNLQLILFAAFAIAFAIKVPIFPLHTWLPDAHTEAPTAGSVLLAGVLLKMGTYGFVRFAMPIFPEALQIARPYIAIAAIIGIIYAALVAMVQKDAKRLVAYSSISHLGFVMLGLMALTPQAVTGAVYQMVNHGISAAGLFLLVGMMYDRTHTRKIADYGGLAKVAPWLAFFFIVVTLSAVALPGTNSFVGEFLILSGSFSTWPKMTIIATLGVIFGAVYMLGMIQKIFFGPTNEKLSGFVDLNKREIFCLIPLAILIFWMGLGPNFFIKKIEPSSQLLVQKVKNQE